MTGLSYIFLVVLRQEKLLRISGAKSPGCFQFELQFGIWAGGIAECLASMCEAVGSITNTGEKSAVIKFFLMVSQCFWFNLYHGSG